jgi:hypothetical protein
MGALLCQQYKSLSSHLNDAHINVIPFMPVKAKKTPSIYYYYSITIFVKVNSYSRY